jgi:hypothetical protein
MAHLAPNIATLDGGQVAERLQMAHLAPNRHPTSTPIPPPTPPPKSLITKNVM